MTKLIIITAAIAGIILSVAIFYYASHFNVDTKLDEIKAYTARKEDLISTQERLALAVQELNQTIQLEMKNQETLAAKVTELSKQADLPPPIINKTTYVQPEPIIIKPIPVTRAS